MKLLPDVKIGLCLGGGGARGLAHIGVLQAIEEYNIPLSLIVGSSMGALIGAVYALNPDVKSLKKKIEGYLSSEDFYKKPFDDLKMVDKSLNGDGFAAKLNRFVRLGGFLLSSALKPSYINIEKFEKNIFSLIEDMDILGTKIPLAVIAADLKSGKEVILTEGPLRKAIMASSAIPGVFPSIQWGDYNLIDGGWTNKIPVEPAFLLGADVVIAVDVSSELADSTDYGDKAYIITNRATALLGEKLKNLQLRFADVVIKPLGGEYHWTDFNALSEIAEKGYRETKITLPSLRQIIRKRRVKKAFERILPRRWKVNLREYSP